MTQTIESKNKFEVPNRHPNGGGEWAVIYTIDQIGTKGRNRLDDKYWRVIKCQPSDLMKGDHIIYYLNQYIFFFTF